jgi:hypothetical protein
MTLETALYQLFRPWHTCQDFEDFNQPGFGGRPNYRWGGVERVKPLEVPEFLAFHLENEGILLKHFTLKMKAYYYLFYTTV